MTKKYQICHHQIRFFKLKMHQMAGEGNTPSPFPSPLDTFGVSNSAPRFSGPPQHKILATPVNVSKKTNLSVS